MCTESSGQSLCDCKPINEYFQTCLYLLSRYTFNFSTKCNKFRYSFNFASKKKVVKIQIEIKNSNKHEEKKCEISTKTKQKLSILSANLINKMEVWWTLVDVAIQFWLSAGYPLKLETFFFIFRYWIFLIFRYESMSICTGLMRIVAMPKPHKSYAYLPFLLDGSCVFDQFFICG